MDNINASGMTNNGLDALNAELDGLDLELAGETIVEDIEEVLEASGEVEPIEIGDEVIEADIVEIEAEAVVETPASVATKADVLDDLDLGDISDEELNAIEASAERAEIYQAQQSTIDTDGSAPVVPEKPAKAKRERKAKDASAAKEPKEKTENVRTPKDLASLEEAVFQIHDDAPADKTFVLSLRPSQVKIAEKFDNLFCALSVGKAPSVYVMNAFEALDTKKTMTATEIAANFKTRGYTDGTSNSQAGQIMALFDATGIAKRTKNTLELSDKSTVAGRLRKLVAERAGA